MYGINSEPPKNCLDCPLCQGEYGKGNEKSYCSINPKVKLKYRGSRPKECPIIVDPLPQWQIEFLEALIEKTKSEWIPVSERLPEKNMVCLVAVGKINLTQIAVYSDLMGTINRKVFYQGDYGHENFEDITQYVNAWQPLPEPYKKGGVE